MLYVCVRARNALRLLAILCFSLQCASCKVKIYAPSTSVQTSASATVESLPVGAILPFDLAACPTGWTDFTLANGRVLVGVGSGNTDADGTALTSRALGDVGGREYTTGIPAYSGAGDSMATGPTLVLSAPTSQAFKAAVADTTLSGAKADSNMLPFIARLYCKKTLSSTSAPDGASAWFDAASCSASGWQSDTAVSGRAILGSGAGNNDADVAALTARALNATGGREFTTGIPAVSAVPADSSTPGPGVHLADISANPTNLFRGGAATTSVSGALADSNLPPYFVLNACKKTLGAVATIDSGMVVAFESASCPTGWSSFSSSAGRVLIGDGTGNTDADGTALTARVYAQSGGREFTTGLPAVNFLGSDSIADPTFSLARSNGFSAYSVNTADTTISGAKADSNMPPFVAVLFCKKD